MSTPVGSYASLDAVAAASVAKDASPGFKFDEVNPKVTFATQGLPPPSPLYVTVNDQLQIYFATLNPAIPSIHVTWRVLTVGGELKRGVLDIPVKFSDGTLQFANVGLSEGFLLSVQLNPAAGGTQVADCYALVRLSPPPASNPGGDYVLINGYVKNTTPGQWPGGTLVNSVQGAGSFETITIADPGAVPSFSITCPANTRWNVMSTFFNYSVGAAAVNRTPRVRLTNAAAVAVFETGWTVAQAPSTGRGYSLGVGCPFGLLADTLAVVGPLPTRVLMSAGDKIFVEDFNWQPGDAFMNVAIRVEQWVDV